jgi:hypothetical protein
VGEFSWVADYTYEQARKNMNRTETFVLVFNMDFEMVDIGKTNSPISTNILEAPWRYRTNGMCIPWNEHLSARKFFA